MLLSTLVRRACRLACSRQPIVASKATFSTLKDGEKEGWEKTPEEALFKKPVDNSFMGRYFGWTYLNKRVQSIWVEMQTIGRDKGKVRLFFLTFSHFLLFFFSTSTVIKSWYLRMKPPYFPSWRGMTSTRRRLPSPSLPLALLLLLPYFWLEFRFEISGWIF